jgi:hypothetical protein
MNKEEACKILNIGILNEVNLKQKYRMALLKFHPDKGGDNDSFRKVIDAYNFLKLYIETNEEKNDNIEYYIELLKKNMPILKNRMCLFHTIERKSS